MPFYIKQVGFNLIFFLVTLESKSCLFNLRIRDVKTDVEKMRMKLANLSGVRQHDIMSLLGLID